MKKHLVVSYDSDHQWWLYTTVFASNMNAAKQRVLDVCPDAIDADVFTASQLQKLVARFESDTRADSEKELQAIAQGSD